MLFTAGTSTFQNYLSQFDGEFSIANLKLTASTDLPNTVNALTHAPLLNNMVEIEFNLNNLDRPSLDVARTLIHEMIHATMYRWMLIAAETGALEPEGGMTQQQLVNYIENLKDNFPGLYDYYVARNFDDWEHEQMAAHFRDIIEDALKEYDSSYPDEVYEALAWEGLKNTSTWNNLTPQEQAAIEATKQNFHNNNPDCE